MVSYQSEFHKFSANSNTDQKFGDIYLPKIARIEYETIVAFYLSLPFSFCG